MAINTEIKIDTMTNYSRNERQTPYTGAPSEEFSKCMYAFKNFANEGFTVTDFDWVIRNHIKRTFAILEVKTHSSNLTYAQTTIFNELDLMLKVGAKVYGMDYKGFHVLTFENTSFRNGKAFLDGEEITGKQFYDWVKHYF